LYLSLAFFWRWEKAFGGRDPMPEGWASTGERRTVPRDEEESDRLGGELTALSPR